MYQYNGVTAPARTQISGDSTTLAPRDLIDSLDAKTTLCLETTTNVSPGGWSHHENPLGRALYVPEEPEREGPGEPAESPKTPSA